MPGGRLSDSTTARYGSDLVVDLLLQADGDLFYVVSGLDTAEAVGPALRRALRVVKDEGRPALVDVITRP